MSEFQYQMMFGLNLLKPRPLFGVILKVCQTKFHQIWISKSEVLHLQIPVPKWEKTKKWEKLFWLTKRDNKGITDPGRSLVIAKFFIFKFQYQNGKKQKSGKNFSGLQNGTIRELQIQAGLQGLQIRARWITDGSSFRERIGTKRLQIRARISNRGKKISKRGRYYKSVQNKRLSKDKK